MQLSFRKKLSSPNPLWQREDTKFLILCMRFFLAHSKSLIPFGMLVLMSIKISSVQVSCLSRVLIPMLKKNTTFVSTYMLKFSEQSRSLEKMVSMRISQWKDHCGNMFTFVFLENRSNENDVTDKLVL
jgi:hypothetical protein